MPRARKATMPVTVGWWVIRGVARQVGFDIRGQRRSAKATFKDWMKRKWLRVPRGIRVTLFVVAVTARGSYRVARQADRAVVAGMKNGWQEGLVRYQESLQLAEAKADFPRRSTYLNDLKTQIRQDRKERAREDFAFAQDAKLSAPPRQPLSWPAPVTISAKKKSATAVPQYPGPPDGGDYGVTAGDRIYSGYSKARAEQLAAWERWRSPSSAVKVSPPSGTATSGSRSKAKTKTATPTTNTPTTPTPTTNGSTSRNGGRKNMASGADTRTVPELREGYQTILKWSPQAKDDLNSWVADLRSDIASIDQTIANLAADEFDKATIAELEALKESLEQMASALDNAASAGDDVNASANKGLSGLTRHQAMEEAVNNSGQVAKSTASYAAH